MPPKVTIVEPNITKQEEKKVLDNIAFTLGKMIPKQYGIEVEYTIERIKG